MQHGYVLDAVFLILIIQIERFGRHHHAPSFQQKHIARLFVVQTRVDLEARADLVGVELAQHARQTALGAVEFGGNYAVPGSEGLQGGVGGGRMRGEHKLTGAQL